MNNPNGPYPGRQLFLGVTVKGHPFFSYLVTGRSPESRERKAVQIGDIIRMGPLGNQPYDPLRHYAAVKFENTSGLVVVSNGIQTEAIFETYKLLLNTSVAPSVDFVEKLLDGAGAEPDSYHTPRIAGIVTSSGSPDPRPVFILGMKAFNTPARGFQISPAPGKMIGISTYKGSLDSPEARDPGTALPEVDFSGFSANDLARHLFDISAAVYKGNDIRVCAVAGIRLEKGWDLSIQNVHQ